MQPSRSAEALALFDSLDAVDAQEMLGAWAGAGFATGHPLDGVLEACHWHGKRFDSLEDVHPLVFRAPTGRLVDVDPRWLALGLPLAMRSSVFRSRGFGRAFQAAVPLLATRGPRARLRMLVHRGRPTAAMVYDSLPIIDVFRRLDRDSVLGLMDLKGMEQPFFFVLRRSA